MPRLSTILLVDDDPTTNFLHKLLLTQMQVADHLVVAENGAEALQTLTQSTELLPVCCPALMLVDVNMPVMGGVAFVQAYHRLALTAQPASVIVMLTTSAHTQELAQLRQLPVAGVLTKPLTRAKVAALLQQHFPETSGVV